ncbi:DUF1707 SHOCT-like domain-containing protein [Streptomyces sp. H27-D2]|uniref:DUF1707 SHOCT-like domain-containing protein n=1 Tax=Streptomyces sp. H27-D2 TaxID=3046304 RepID=UPI002DBD92B4|nr:DUF1707 domain-containing protein [Streptomyces sp. H27-D2]MEC4015152.1 DUF1707 domain-containing protein [Streptomyces sp. H27-D2]
MTSDLPELRASDADRERVAEVLRDAVAEGRIALDEFDERLDGVYKARTYSELEPFTRDLPAAMSGAASPAAPAAGGSAGSGGWAHRIGGRATSRVALGILGGFQRKGAWVMPRRLTTVCVMGGGEIDLTEARFEGRDVVIRCFAVMGGTHVVVPQDAEVEVTGFGLMGGFDSSAAGAGVPGAPRILVTGFAFWGGVGVDRRLPKAERLRLKAEREQHRSGCGNPHADRKSLD